MRVCVYMRVPGKTGTHDAGRGKVALWTADYRWEVRYTAVACDRRLTCNLS
jgi:hypothetical protein